MSDYNPAYNRDRAELNRDTDAAYNRDNSFGDPTLAQNQPIDPAYDHAEHTRQFIERIETHLDPLIRGGGIPSMMATAIRSCFAELLSFQGHDASADPKPRDETADVVVDAVTGEVRPAAHMVPEGGDLPAEGSEPLVRPAPETAMVRSPFVSGMKPATAPTDPTMPPGGPVRDESGASIRAADPMDPHPEATLNTPGASTSSAALAQGSEGTAPAAAPDAAGANHPDTGLSGAAEWREPLQPEAVDPLVQDHPAAYDPHAPEPHTEF